MEYIFKFQLKDKLYQVRVPENLEHYVLELKDSFGLYKKVPCFTDREEKKYPKDAAYVGLAFLTGLKNENLK